MADASLLFSTVAAQYIARNDDVSALRTAHVGNEYTYDLGALLGECSGERVRRPGLVIPLRRKAITLLVEQVDLLAYTPRLHGLPALLHKHLRQPWVLAVAETDAGLCIQLDLRALAQTAFATR